MRPLWRCRADRGAPLETNENAGLRRRTIDALIRKLTVPYHLQLSKASVTAFLRIGWTYSNAAMHCGG